MICYEWRGIIDNGIPINTEVGIRKAPGTQVTRENQRLLSGDDADSIQLDYWWYDYKYNFQSIDTNIIIEEMKAYINKIQRVVNK